MGRFSQFLIWLLFASIIISAQSDSSKSPSEAVSDTISPASDTLKAGTVGLRKPVINIPKKRSRSWVTTVLENKGRDDPGDTATAAAADTVQSPYEMVVADKRNAVPLLIMRPVSGYTKDELDDIWLLYLCESYIHFKLSGVPALEIVSPDTLSRLMHAYKVYTNAIPISEYQETARHLSVPYMLYIECRYLPIIRGGGLPFGNDVSILGKVSSIDGEDIVNFSTQCALKEFGSVLDRFVIQIVEKLGIPPEKQNRDFLEMTLMGTRKNNVKKMGELLAVEKKKSRKEFQEFHKDYNTFMSKDQDMVVGYYAGVQFCVKREQYGAAADFSYALIHRLRDNYPPGFLMAAENYRKVKNYEQALRIINQAESIEAIHIALMREKTLCLTAQAQPEDEQPGGKAKK